MTWVLDGGGGFHEVSRCLLVHDVVLPLERGHWRQCADNGGEA